MPEQQIGAVQPSSTAEVASLNDDIFRILGNLRLNALMYMVNLR